jgi:hypothetical protein
MQRGFSGVLLLFLVLLLAAGGFGSYYFYNQKKLSSINSFEDCAKHFPVMESYPAQCNTSDGKHFVQVLNDQKLKNLTVPTESSPSSRINESTTSAKIDAQVWNDVHIRVVVVNLFYSKYKRLPVSLAEVTQDPEFFYFKETNNPIDDKPYNYTILSDKKGFEVSGVQNDGVLYKEVIEID